MKPLRLSLLLGLTLAASACATVPPPIDQLMAAELAIQRADLARGGEASSSELRAAKAKLAAAREAVARRENLPATRLAVEAQLDADLATARTEAAKAQFNVEATRKSNEALRQQVLRNSANVAPIPIPAAIPPPIPAPIPAPFPPADPVPTLDDAPPPTRY